MAPSHSVYLQGAVDGSPGVPRHRRRGDPTVAAMPASAGAYTPDVSSVSVRGLERAYGDRPALAATDLDIAPGEFVSLIGPSGCGKSTLLRIVAGLDAPTAGRVEIDGRSPLAARTAKQVAVVPQQPALLPWRSVRDNARLLLDLGGAARGRGGDDRSVELLHLLEEVGLRDSLDALPHQLSGGMQQRVALVRALVLGAPLLLMDEPFAALDEITRASMRVLLNRLVEGRDATVLFVTHSVTEAVALADRVVVLSPRPGRVVADVSVGLPRPRPDDVDDDPRFVERCSEVRHHLRSTMLGEAAP